MTERSDAWLNGWLAHKADYSWAHNPYDQYLQKRSYAQWLAGWHEREYRNTREWPGWPEGTEYDNEDQP